MQRSERIKEQLAGWRDDLVDLSRRNNLLYCKAGTARSIVRIVAPGATQILARLASHPGRGWEFAYPDSSELAAGSNLVEAPSQTSGDQEGRYAEHEFPSGNDTPRRVLGAWVGTGQRAGSDA
ncbi:MAG: hypothetical protein ACYC0E_16150 [Acidimicrobiales bacterium]